MELLIYLLIKFFAYSGWIYLGLRVFRGDRAGFIVYSLLLGGARVIFGLILGAIFLVFVVPFLSVAFLGSRALEPDSDLSIFLSILPVSILLWVLCAKIVAGKLYSKAVMWSLGAAAISALFDFYALNNMAQWGGKGMC